MPLLCSPPRSHPKKPSCLCAPHPRPPSHIRDRIHFPRPCTRRCSISFVQYCALACISNQMKNECKIGTRQWSVHDWSHRCRVQLSSYDVTASCTVPQYYVRFCVVSVHFKHLQLMSIAVNYDWYLNSYTVIKNSNTMDFFQPYYFYAINAVYQEFFFQQFFDSFHTKMFDKITIILIYFHISYNHLF